MVDLNALIRLLDEAALEVGNPVGWEPRRVLGSAFYFDDHQLADIRKQIDSNWMEFRDVNGYLEAAAFCEEPNVYFLTYKKACQLDLVSEVLAKHPDSSFRISESEVELIHSLSSHGFSKTDRFTYQLEMKPLEFAEHSLPNGFNIGSMTRTESDQSSMADMLNESFGRSYHNAGEYRNFQNNNPRYREDLDLVVRLDSGKIVANVAFTLFGNDEFAILEPAGVHPDFQGQGLASALISEGIKRLAELGVSSCFVEASGTNPVALATYTKAGFVEYDRQYLWVRQ